MKWQALGAIAVCLLVILFYLAARFEFRYGVGEIVALVHTYCLPWPAVFGIRIDLTWSPRSLPSLGTH